MACKYMLVALCVGLIMSPLVSASAVNENSNANSNANPIRRVVSMLQAMQAKLTEEAKKETELYEKYMCYCKSSGSGLQADIEGSTAKIPQVEAAIKEAESTKVQLEQDIKDHQASRAEAKQAMADAKALREKEASAYEEESTKLKTDIAALEKAIAALMKGMTGGFLQTNAAQVLQQLAVSDSPDLNDYDRQTLTSFLSSGQNEDGGYVPQSGEITGILKEIKDTMSKNLSEATAAEEAAIKTYDALMAAKTKEVEASTAAIETKTVRVGEIGVEIAQMKNDLDDTAQALLADKEFLADLEKNCATKESEWDEIVKLRNQEMVALADTIKILNDDDALELFKKTLPTPSLVQIAAGSARARKLALSILHNAKTPGHDHRGLDLITLALSGKKVNFDKVFKLIDELVETLKAEQLDDDHKKENCEIQLDSVEDKKKVLSHDISDLEAVIDESTEKISTLVEEIKALEDGIATLDKEVAEQTETRKDEHKEYTELMASDSAAKELLALAKNRLNKFYNPKLYQPPPKRVLTEEERIYSNMGGDLGPAPALVQINVHRSVEHVAPPPPPESFGAYAKKSEESNGVIGMLDLLVADLDKEMTEAETTEKNAQAEYTSYMSDAAQKRADDSKSLTDKAAAKAEAEGDLEMAKEGKTAKGKELMATEEYLASLHGECDWLLSNFDLRKEARDGEIESLAKAKAVLAGADYSFVQRRSALRGA